MLTGGADATVMVGRDSAREAFLLTERGGHYEHETV